MDIFTFIFKNFTLKYLSGLLSVGAPEMVWLAALLPGHARPLVGTRPPAQVNQTAMSLTRRAVAGRSPAPARAPGRHPHVFFPDSTVGTACRAETLGALWGET